MQKSREYILDAIRRELQKVAPGAKAILYGSRARGDNKPDSDWDVLILLDKPKLAFDDFGKISYPLMEMGWEMNEMISPQLYTLDEWHNKYNVSLFYKKVEQDGIEL